MPFLPRTAFAKRQLTVAYRGSLEKQILDIRLQIGRKAPGPTGVGAMLAVVGSINRGVAGGADFDPSKGQARILSGPLKDTDVGARGPRFAWKIEVAGVCPLHLRNIIEVLRTFGFPMYEVVSMAVKGSLPLDDTPLSVRESDVLPWLSTWCEDSSHYPRAWPTPSVRVARVASPRGATVRLELADGEATKANADQLTRHLGAWAFSVVSYPNRKMDGPGHMQVFPEIVRSKNELTARFDVFDYVAGPSSDMLVNTIERFHGRVAPLAKATIALPKS